MKAPLGFWFGELTGSGVGLCHVFSEYARNDPYRLPHTAVCGASTGRGAEVVEILTRPMCKNCQDWLGCPGPEPEPVERTTFLRRQLLSWHKDRACMDAVTEVANDLLAVIDDLSPEVLTIVETGIQLRREANCDAHDKPFFVVGVDGTPMIACETVEQAAWMISSYRERRKDGNV